MTTIPLICWIVVCGGIMSCKEYRVRVTSAEQCSKKINERGGIITKAMGHLLPIFTKEAYERECGKEGIDCK